MRHGNDFPLRRLFRNLSTGSGVKFRQLSEKYHGDVASSYEDRRQDGKWHAENDAARDLIELAPLNGRTLDVPVGTGRLIPFIDQHSADAYGVDISPDMLAEAQRQAVRVNAKIKLRQADIRNLPFPDAHFDLVSCLRFLNWINFRGVEEVMAELVRVSRSHILIGIRVFTNFSEVPAGDRRLLPQIIQRIGVPVIRTRRWGLSVHRRRALEALFRRLNLKVVKTRLVERRWDGTDYEFFLLQKA